MRSRISAIFCVFAVALLVFPSQAFAQTGPNEANHEPPTGPMVNVVDIEFLGVSGGESNVEVPAFNFFSVGSAGAHLNLATGHINEVVHNPATNKGLWWDIDLKVTVSLNDLDTLTGQPQLPVMLAIDKDVLNQTRWRWTDFHMTLGMRGPDGSFMESDEFDFLFFKDTPPSINTSGHFDNPPMQDEPVAPDNLWWFANNTPGVLPGELAKFWLGIQIPPSKFDPGTGMARFVLREHATVPEPATVALLVSLGMGLLATRRRES